MIYYQFFSLQEGSIVRAEGEQRLLKRSHIQQQEDLSIIKQQQPQSSLAPNTQRFSSTSGDLLWLDLPQSAFFVEINKWRFVNHFFSGQKLLQPQSISSFAKRTDFYSILQKHVKFVYTQQSTSRWKHCTFVDTIFCLGNANFALGFLSQDKSI